MLVLSRVQSSGEVVISEFVAENDGGIRDSDGDQMDWIELHNTGAVAENLAGWRLTDNAQAPAKWQFPDVSLAPNARLVVFASEKDRRVAGEELHTNFRLANEGGYLALSKPDGTITREFNPYPAQRADISFGDGLLLDGQELITASSPGKYLVPNNGTLETLWTAVGFNDGTWTAATSRPGYQAGGPRPGMPQTYWTFDDTTANSIAGAPEATLMGPTYDALVPSAIGEGKSLHFATGTSSYVTAQVNVSETSYTSSFWFRTTASSIGLFSIVDGDLGANGYDRLLYLSNGNIFARTWNNETIGSTGKNYGDGQWHHVAHVLGGSVGAQRIFVDGVQVALGSKAISDFTWQQRINFGFTNDAGANAHFRGEMDDLAVWSEALNGTSIASLASGTPPDVLAGFGPFIGTNVEGAMRNVNASLYLRLPFTVNRAIAFNQATLRVRYDDGFIAYIDGVEVARRNAPASAGFNASATFDRNADDATEFESIDISAHVGLLTNGSHLLAIHGLNDAAGSPDFLINAELSAATVTPQTNIYMDPATPGQPNSTGFAGFVADTVFNPKRGFYDTAQNVTITSATPGATIAYTTDGSDPSPVNGTQVPAANGATLPSVTIPVSGTRYIRAMAHKPGSGMRPTNVDSHTYIFINQVLSQSNTQAGYPATWAGRTADYAMDPNVVNTTLPGFSVREGLLAIPSVSLTARVEDLFGVPNGIYYDTQLRGLSAERKVSIEWINPDGSPGWHAQCGTRIHGNSSRQHGFTPKHTMRLMFRGAYGYGKLREDVFGGGVDSFDQLLLRGCSTDSMPVGDGNFEDGEQRWNNDKATYIRDQWMRDVLNDLGNPNPRGVYCHLYINGLYWGLYNLSERPTASFFADTFGGEEEEWDVLKDFSEVHDGNATAWSAMMGIVNDGALSYEARAQKLLGKNPDGTPNAAFPVYLHLASFIDYMIVHIAAGAEDWPDHNWWVGRRRGPLSEGFRFISWDQEIANDSLTRVSGRGSGNPFEAVGNPANQSPPDRNGPAGVYDTLRRAPTFQAMFRERIHYLLFNNGPLSPTANRARWMLRQMEIDKAIVGESARWGDAANEPAKKRETTWLGNMNFMNTPVTGYWDAIFPIDVQRFRNVALYPSINQATLSRNGGVVPQGFELHFNTDQPTAYYTLDGSDPMGANGQPSPSAQIYTGGVARTNVIPQGAIWRYLVTPIAAPVTWKDITFDDSSWAQGIAQLGYGDGDEATAIGYGGNPSARYITTYFRRKFTINSLPEAATLSILRDDGAVIYLNGKSVARSNMHPTADITYSSLASSNVGGADEATNFYNYTLSPNDFVIGENVLAVEVHKVSAAEDDLSFDAQVEVTGSVSTTPVTLTQSGPVRVRARSPSGEWSGVNGAYFIVGAEPINASNVVVSELHYQPGAPTRPEELALTSDPDEFEFIELMNISANPVDLTGAAFAAGIEFAFPTGYTLGPGGHCVVVKNEAAFTARYGAGRNVAGVFANGTGLNNGGEIIRLVRVEGQNSVTVREFTYDDVAPWPVAADGGGPSLVLRNPAANPDHNVPVNWTASADRGGTPARAPSEMTFGDWRRAYRDDLLLNGDDDGDGLSNALEYAFALNPLVRNANALPAGQVITVGNERYLAMTLRYRPGTDLTVAPESSANLLNWSGEATLVNTFDHGDGTRSETWRYHTPISAASAGKQYLRAHVTITE